MNRQQFLTELSQYLTFFSPEEKAQIISAYNEKFNSAGPENEAVIIAELGTPMMTAIDLKRRVEAGEQISIAPEADLKEIEPLAEYSVETETAETLAAESCQADSQGLSEEPSEAKPQASPESATEAASPKEISAEAPSEIPVAPAPEAPVEKPVTPLSPRIEYIEQEAPSRKVSVPKLIGATLLSIIITAVFLAVAAVGVIVLVAMSYLLLTGLKNLVYITDALLLFGGGLVCAGLGLIIIWFAVWSAISLISRLFRNALGIASDKECAL